MKTSFLWRQEAFKSYLVFEEKDYGVWEFYLTKTILVVIISPYEGVLDPLNGLNRLASETVQYP